MKVVAIVLLFAVWPVAACGGKIEGGASGSDPAPERMPAAARDTEDDVTGCQATACLKPYEICWRGKRSVFRFGGQSCDCDVDHGPGSDCGSCADRVTDWCSAP